MNPQNPDPVIQKLKAVATLIRLPNLVFILLTQVITWYSLVRPVLQALHHTVVLQGPWLAILAGSTLCIAAAGYMINDYFDIGIDLINKPGRVTIERVFKRRLVITWHIVLNILALLLAGNLAWRFVLLRVVLVQLLCILLLLWYSVTLKRQLITGNLVISLLTALTLLTVALYEPGFPMWDFKIQEVRLFWLYLVFAFLVTWAREIVKDIEDLKGDGMRDCQTIPLVWGVNVARRFVYAIVVTLVILLLGEAILLYPAQTGLLLYWIIVLCIPFIFLLLRLRQSNHSTQFHAISSLLKWITLAGILSMLLI